MRELEGARAAIDAADPLAVRHRQEGLNAAAGAQIERRAAGRRTVKSASAALEAVIPMTCSNWPPGSTMST